MSRFDRTFRLLVGRVGPDGLEITPPMRITFEVEKDTEEEPNFHKIQIFNLNPEHRRELEQTDMRVLLYAGYAEEDGALPMAAGAVVDTHTFYDGPNVVTELRVADGFIELRDSAVSLGYGPGVMSSTIQRDIAKQMNLPLLLGEDVPDRSWANGFSYYGSARTAMHKVSAGAGAEWSIQNQQMQVIAKQGVTRRQAIVLAADTGMLGYPERTHENAREKATVTDKTTGKDQRLVSAKRQRYGWKIKSLLLPTVSPGDLVKIESRTEAATGFWRVEKVTHNGDSAGGDWQTELQVVSRDEPPKPKKKK